MVSDRNRWRRTLLGTIALLAGVAVVLFGIFWLVDFFYLHADVNAGREPLERLFAFDPETLQNALGNLAQIIAAVLGIAITVVSIVVQLAATRYTPRVADMFFRDRTNLAVMGFFVVACINAVWVSLAVSRDYVPVATVLATVGLVTASLLALMPYFAYVFDFLDPEKVVARIGQQTLESALGRTRRAAEPTSGPPGSDRDQHGAAGGRRGQRPGPKDKVIAAGRHRRLAPGPGRLPAAKIHPRGRVVRDRPRPAREPRLRGAGARLGG